jgi:hypothetical protein
MPRIFALVATFAVKTPSRFPSHPCFPNLNDLFAFCHKEISMFIICSFVCELDRCQPDQLPEPSFCHYRIVIQQHEVLTAGVLQPLVIAAGKPRFDEFAVTVTGTGETS